MEPVTGPIGSPYLLCQGGSGFRSRVVFTDSLPRKFSVSDFLSLLRTKSATRPGQCVLFIAGYYSVFLRKSKLAVSTQAFKVVFSSSGFSVLDGIHVAFNFRDGGQFLVKEIIYDIDHFIPGSFHTERKVLTLSLIFQRIS